MNQSFMRKTKKGNQLKFLRFNKLLLLGLLCTFSLGAFAQSKSITGQVTDSAGDPIPGATVMVKGTTSGTITNIDGNYELKADGLEQGTLVISFIGMKSQEVLVNGRSQINIPLVSDILEINEVVVVGYGTQQKKDVTGAVALIGSDELVSRPNTNVGSLIMGKAAGVQVLSSSGKPSQGLSMRIRGTNSFNASSEPLYVVDGIPTTDTRSINPADIESISVLKDASAAAIYGSRGANGVVLITSKKGREGKPVVSLDMYTGFASIPQTLKVLNGEQYRDLMEEMGKSTQWENYTAQTDWQNEVYQTAASKNIQGSFSGKSDKTTYYMSVGATLQEGVVVSSEMARSNFMLNLDQDLRDWLTIGARMSYAKYEDTDVVDNQSINSGGVILGALGTPSIIGIYNADGSFTSNPLQNWENPMAAIGGANRNYSNNRLLGNIYAKFNITKDLSFKSNYSLQESNSVYDYFLNPYLTSYGQTLVGKGQNKTDRSTYSSFENILSFNKKTDNHSIDAFAGIIAQNDEYEYADIQAEGYSSAIVETTNGGAIKKVAENKKEKKTNLSYIARFNYGFRDKYLATATLRADGSSNFASENRWGYFPALSLGWRISQEDFMKEIDYLSDLKLRAGWAVVGNDQIGKYAYLGTVGSGANYPIGDVTQSGTYPASLENRDLKWEESEGINVGIDAAFLDSRIRFSIDGYLKKTTDALLKQKLPGSTGYSEGKVNIGNLENRGIEFTLSTVNIDKEVDWTTDFNLSINRNEVTSLVASWEDGEVAGRGTSVLIDEGLALGTFYGYKWGGVDPATGDAYYIAKDGSSTFTPTPEDKQVIGDPNPDFTFGFNNTVSYKGVSLMLFLEGVYGSDVLNATRMETEGMTDPKNQSADVLRRWRKPGDITDIPRSAADGLTKNSRVSDRFIEDGSYMRVKTLTLSYDFPKLLVAKAKLTNLRLYVTGENLFTFSNYSGYDPQVNSYGNAGNNASNFVQNVDYGTFPQSRNIIFGAKIDF